MRRTVYSRLSVALALTSVTFFATSAYGQAPGTRQSNTENKVAAQGQPPGNTENKVVAQGQPPGNTENKVAAPEQPRGNTENKVAASEQPPGKLEDEVAAMRAENIAVLEQLRKMKEQQEALLELVKGLQQQLNGNAIAEASHTPQPPGAAQPAENSVPSTAVAEASVPSPSVSPAQARSTADEHYQDGIVIWQTPDDAKVPLLMRFNLNTQVRYLNTTSCRRHFHRPSGRCPRGPKAK